MLDVSICNLMDKNEHNIYGQYSCDYLVYMRSKYFFRVVNAEKEKRKFKSVLYGNKTKSFSQWYNLYF